MLLSSWQPMYPLDKPAVDHTNACCTSAKAAGQAFTATCIVYLMYMRHEVKKRDAGKCCAIVLLGDILQKVDIHSSSMRLCTCVGGHFVSYTSLIG